MFACFFSCETSGILLCFFFLFSRGFLIFVFFSFARLLESCLFFVFLFSDVFLILSMGFPKEYLPKSRQILCFFQLF